MPSNDLRPYDLLSVVEQEVIDAVCDRFESAWKSSGPAKLSPYVEEVDVPLQGALLHELILLDIDYRRRRGLSREKQEYLESFSHLAENVESSFRKYESDGRAESLASDAPHPTATARAEADDFAQPAEPNSRGDTQTLQSDVTTLEFDPPKSRSNGDYELLEEIGRGGMGVVYKARQVKLDRLVALKMIRDGQGGHGETRQRFRAEAQAAARLKHPGIVPIFEVGHLDGRDFYSMPLIQGDNLEQRLAAEPLAPVEAARLAEELARAVQYAHSGGIVHRDLKPANVLLEEGRPMIADFGLAKRRENDGDSQGLTQEGFAMGTPGYMSPEQALGAWNEVKEGADVYGLGAILYAMLCQRPPFQSNDPLKALQQVREDAPVPPRRLNPDTPRDLETICLKCLEKSPAARYESAGHLADDLQRFRAHKPIQAQPPGMLGRFFRWCYRKPLVAGLSAALVCLLLLAIASVTAFAVSESRRAVESERQRKTADQAKQEAERLLAYNQILRIQSQQKYWQVAIRTGELDIVPSHLPRDLPYSWDGQYLVQAATDRVERIGHLSFGRDSALAAAADPAGKRLVAALGNGCLVVWDLQTHLLQKVLAFPERPRPEGGWSHHLLDRPTEGSVESWGLCVVAVCWLGDSDRVVGASLDGRGFIWDVRTGKRTEILRGRRALWAVAATDDQQQVLFGDADGRLILCTTSGEQLVDLPPPAGDRAGVTAIAARPSRRQWIVGRENGRVAWREAENLKLLRARQLAGPVFALDIREQQGAPRVAVADNSSQVTLLDLDDRSMTLQVETPLMLADPGSSESVVQAVSFSRDGRYLFGLASDGRLYAWSAANSKRLWSQRAVINSRTRGRLLRALRKRGETELPFPFRRRSRVVLQSGASGRLLTAGDDIWLRIWSAPARDGSQGIVQKRLVGPFPRMAFFSHTSRLLWIIDRNGALWVIDALKRTVVAKQPAAHPAGLCELAGWPGRDRVVTCGSDGRIRTWHYSEGKIEPVAAPSFQVDRPLLSVALRSDGHYLAAVDDGAQLRVWETETKRLVTDAPLFGAAADDGPAKPKPAAAPPRPLTGRCAFQPQGDYLAAFGMGQVGSFFRWDNQRKAYVKQKEQLPVAGAGGTALLWNPADARFLIASDNHPRVFIRAVTSDSPAKGSPFVPSHPVVEILGTPDAQRLLLLERGGPIHVLDTGHYLNMLQLETQLEPAHALAIDRGGVHLVAAGQDGSLEFWSHEQPADYRVWKGPITDRRKQWTHRQILPHTKAIIRADQRCVALDSQDRVCLTYCVSQRRKQSDGSLHFLRAGPRQVLQERIRLDDPDLDERMSPIATGMHVLENDQPVIAFRRRTADENFYDGTFHLAVRETDGWRLQMLHPHGNFGFFPSIVAPPTTDKSQSGMALADASQLSIFHFSFERQHFLMHTQRDPSGRWNNPIVGEFGDGYRMERVRDAQGRWHLFSGRNVDNIGLSSVYHRWNPETGEMVREELPETDYRGLLKLSPEDEPVVFGTRYLDALRQPQVQLMVRRDGRWQHLLDLPSQPFDFGFDGKGQLVIARWEQQQKKLLLLRHDSQGNAWRADWIAGPFPEGRASRATLLFDQQGDPVVVLGYVEKAYSWLRVVRKHKLTPKE